MRTHLIFRILYKTFYTILGICLFSLLVITPADAIHQALNNKQLYNIFVIGGAYAVTFFIAILIYTLRIYTNKTVVNAIPKAWIPIEKGDVSKQVRKMIVAGFARSATIAWDSRPRIETTAAPVIPDPDTQPDARDAVVLLATAREGKKKQHTVLQKRRTDAEKDEEIIASPPDEPMWGIISHNGWSSPISPDLPNLQYITIIQELPHLIEAKAVSVAPPDPESTSNPPMPDIRAVDLLQRPAPMGLRDYIAHLISVDIITAPSVANDFLLAYEYARFSSQPLTEIQFRDLMKQFAELLRSMQSLSPAILASFDMDNPESDIDDDNSSVTTPSTQRSRSLASSHNVSTSTRSGSQGTIRTAPSRRVGTSGTSTTQRFPMFSTAPATPKSRRRVISRTPSANSFAQSRRPYNGSSSSSFSLASSQGSVIRLSSRNEEQESGQPYTFTIPGPR